MGTIAWVAGAGGLGTAALAAYAVFARNMHYWLGSYVANGGARRRALEKGATVYVCVADHYEPYGGGVGPDRARERVRRWVETYPVIASKHGDSTGRPPCHTFFYPIEEYDPELIDELAQLCRRGFGDVEIHYHHDGDTAENLRRTLVEFARTLRTRHGLLREASDREGIAYCFVHGNWALDNSRPDGRWCGVDNEIQVLVDTGCRADFTMPSAPSDTQTRKINSIYFCKGRPGRRKSHDSGRDVEVGTWGAADELLMVQGPLGLNWGSRKWGVIPRIENGEISADAPPTRERVALWSRLAPDIIGAEQHVFLKLHTHGAEDPTLAHLLGEGFDIMWSALEERFRDAPGVSLRYMTAWEMYETIASIAASGAKGARNA